MRHLRLFLLLLTFPTALAAQTPQWLNFTATLEFRDIATNDTMIWVATDGGLLCYHKIDKTAKLLTRAEGNLPINELYSVALSPDGKLWLGTPIGVARQINGSWQLINPVPDNPVCGPYSIGRKVRSDGQNGVWWFGVKNSLWHFDGHVWTKYDAEALFNVEEISDFELRPDGKLWVYVAKYQNETFYLFDGTTAVDWGFSDFLPDPPGSRKVYDWTVDGQGRLWFSSGNVLGVPNSNGSWTLQTLAFWPDQICANAAGEIWALDDGELRRRLTGGSWETPALPYIHNYYDEQLYTGADGLPLFFDNYAYLLHFNGAGLDTLQHCASGMPGNSVVEFAVGGDQTIWTVFDEDFHVGWIGGQDLARFENGAWTTFSGQMIGSHYLGVVKDIKTDKAGRLWAAAADQFAQYDNGAWNFYTAPEMPWGLVYSMGIHPSGSPVWLGGHRAIGRFDQSTGQTTVFASPPAEIDLSLVKDLEVDQAGNVWLAAFHDAHHHGMLRFDGSAWTFFSCTDMQLGAWGQIHDVAVAPDGKLWVLANSGVACFDGNQWTKFTAGFPYVGEYISIAFDGDAVWLGCYLQTCFTPNINLALLKVEHGFVTFFPFTQYPLPYPNITALAVDGYRNLWIGGEKGGIAVMRPDGVILDASGPKTPAPTVSARLTPNPVGAGREIRVQFDAQAAGSVQFELLDLNGRALFREQWHTPDAGAQERLLRIPAGVPAGLYGWRLLESGRVSGGMAVLAGVR